MPLINQAAYTGRNATPTRAGVVTLDQITAQNVLQFASPPPIGSTTPNTGKFTTLQTTSTITSGAGIVASTGNISTTVGAITSATNLTATNGNIVLGTLGKRIIVPTGSNASAGTSAAMSGTPGVVTVATTACSSTCQIFYSRKVTGGTPGNVSITAQDGTGFTLTSTANETSTFNWWIINA